MNQIRNSSLSTQRTDGGALHTQIWNPDGDPTVLLLHGMGQTRQAWTRTAYTLSARGLRVCAPDLRGHGDSDWARPPAGYSLDELVDDTDRLLDAIGRPAAIVGSSIGGLVGLLAEARNPSSWALALVDITARVEPAGSERIRAFMHDTLAGFDSLEEVAEAIATYRGDDRRRASSTGLTRLIRATDDGRYRWHWDPRLIERPPLETVEAGTIEAAAASVRAPVLLVRGQNSDVVSPAGVAEMRALVPHADYVDVAGAGHTVAGDNNDRFSAAVLDFLSAVTPADAR